MLQIQQLGVWESTFASRAGSAEGEGGSSQNMSVEYSAMSATLTSWDLAAEAFALRTRRAPYPLRDVPVSRLVRCATYP